MRKTRIDSENESSARRTARKRLHRWGRHTLAYVARIPLQCLAGQRFVRSSRHAGRADLCVRRGRSAPHEQWLNAGIAASRRPCKSVTGCSSWHLGDGPVHHALSPGGARACRRSVRKVRRRCRQAGPMLVAGTPRTGAPPCKPGGWRPGMARPAATASMTRMYASTRECLSWRIDAWGYAMATLCWGGCVASTTCQGGTGRIDPADRRVWRAGHGRRGAKRQS